MGGALTEAAEGSLGERAGQEESAVMGGWAWGRVTPGLGRGPGREVSATRLISGTGMGASRGPWDLRL